MIPTTTTSSPSSSTGRLNSSPTPAVWPSLTAPVVGSTVGGSMRPVFQTSPKSMMAAPIGATKGHGEGPGMCVPAGGGGVVRRAGSREAVHTRFVVQRRTMKARPTRTSSARR